MRKRTIRLLSLLVSASIAFSQPLAVMAEADSEAEMFSEEDANLEAEMFSEEDADAAAESESETYPYVKVNDWISETFPFYVPVFSSDQELDSEQEITLYFRDSDSGRDIPYLSMNDGIEMLPKIEALMDVGTRAEIQSVNYDSLLGLIRGDAMMILDCEDGTIEIDNYDGFFASEDGSLIEMGLGGSEGNGYLTLGENNFSRKGNMVTFDLAHYDIDMYQVGEDIYLPLQTYCDIFLMFDQGMLLYNKECVVFESGTDIYMEDYYFTGKAGLRSDALIEFTYNELCMALDANYGLKEEHNISDFNELFLNTGLYEPLMSDKAVDVVTAMNELTMGYMGDLHSAMVAPSYLAGASTINWNSDKTRDIEVTQTIWDDTSEPYLIARTEAMGEDVPLYQEIGNTAYVTFDAFTYQGTDYYSTSVSEQVKDTMGILIYAHSQIMREDSPIENVVLDLSNNGGGAVTSAIFTISWLLGSCTINIQDSQTKAQSSVSYIADVNLDHKYDELDTIQSKKVFILISPASFSCGNLVPSVCKAAGDGKVTLIGETTGGGACIVQGMSLADGTRIQISSRFQISYVRNGAFHNVENGVEPDVRITDPANLYDREALTDYINNIR